MVVLVVGAPTRVLLATPPRFAAVVAAAAAAATTPLLPRLAPPRDLVRVRKASGKVVKARGRAE